MLSSKILHRILWRGVDSSPPISTGDPFNDLWRSIRCPGVSNRQAHREDLVGTRRHDKR